MVVIFGLLLVLAAVGGFASAERAGSPAAHAVSFDHATLPSPPVTVLHQPAPTSHNVVFVSYFGRSHMIPYLEALAQLKLRGHNVTVVTDPSSTHWIQPYGFHLKFVPDEVVRIMHQATSAVKVGVLDPNARFGMDQVVEKIMLPQHPIVYPILMEMFERLRPAHVLCDFMAGGCMDAADMLNISYSLVLSGIPPGANDAPYLVSWSSKYKQHSTTEGLTFLQRMDMVLIEPVVNMYRMMGAGMKLEKVKKQLGITTADRHTKRTAPTLINTFFGFETPRPLNPLVHLMGPVASYANSTMPADLEAWMTETATQAAARRAQLHSSKPAASKLSNAAPVSSESSFVYIAFGSHAGLGQQQVDAIMTAMTDLIDSGIIDGVFWATGSTKRAMFPPASELHPAVKLLSWAPQKAILAHPAVRVFMSHGGAESCHESMFAATPMLIMPFFGDQPSNAAKLAAHGLALTVSPFTVTSEALKSTFTTMIRDEGGRFDAAAKRMQALALMNSKYATQRAADLLEFGMQYGWDHLQPASHRMSWVKANNVDVYALAAVIAVVCTVGLVKAAVVMGRVLVVAAAGKVKTA
eukprot:jgi/Chrzof1/3388/Cz12g23170.t1